MNGTYHMSKLCTQIFVNWSILEISQQLKAANEHTALAMNEAVVNG